MKKIVIIGSSVAGHTVALTLRELNKDCQIILINEENYFCYDKRRFFDLLAGGLKEKDLILANDKTYKENNIEFIKDAKVTTVNTDRGIVYLKNREAVSFDSLVIASGKKFIPSQIPGAKKEGVFCLYSLSDSKKFLDYSVRDSVCIVGSSVWAVGVANALSLKNKDIRLVSTNGSNAGLSQNVEVINSSISEIIGESQVQAVKLAVGKIIAVSAVIFMDELKSNVDFLKNTDIELLEGSIFVDENMRTNLPNVFAVGSVCVSKDQGGKIKSWEDVESESRFLANSLKGLFLDLTVQSSL